MNVRQGLMAVLILASVTATNAVGCYGDGIFKTMKSEELASELLNYARRTTLAEEEKRYPTGIIKELRSRGRTGLDAMLAERAKITQSRPSKASVGSKIDINAVTARFDAYCDRVAGQRFATYSKLFWHTSLEDAKKEAATQGLPILSLRMLGRLDEEMSCANSRFFRTVLYPDPQIANVLRKQYVLHWQTVVDVPKVTIDFGNGRKLERPLTGNSMHMVLNSEGTPLDAMPGLVTPAVFATWLGEVDQLHRDLASMPKSKRREAIVAFHREREPQRYQSRHELDMEKVARLSPLDSKWQEIAAQYHPSRSRKGQRLAVLSKSTRKLVARQVPAEVAMPIAMSKRIIETPVLRMVRKLEDSLFRDTAYNVLALQPKIDKLFTGDVALNEQQLTSLVYNQVFLMPLNDPWLGLSPGDEFVAIDEAGRTSPEGSKWAAFRSR
ncbi:MAG: hypothetical protein AAF497_19225 [Planctomycetota bacterium]